MAGRACRPAAPEREPETTNRKVRVGQPYHSSIAAQEEISTMQLSPERINAILTTIGTVLAAAIIAYAGIQAARTIQPNFVQVGPFLLNVNHIVEVIFTSNGGCRVVLINALPVNPDKASIEREMQFTGHSTGDQDECVDLRNSLVLRTSNASRGHRP